MEIKISRKKHLLSGIMSSILLWFGLDGLDLTKTTPENIDSVVEYMKDNIDNLDIEISTRHK